MAKRKKSDRGTPGVKTPQEVFGSEGLATVEKWIALEPDADVLLVRFRRFSVQMAKNAQLKADGLPVEPVATWDNLDVMLFLGLVDGHPPGTREHDVVAFADLRTKLKAS